MQAVFDRDTRAAFYAKRHTEVDPGIRAIYYLPVGAPSNEIRLVEVNELIRSIASPEPIDFGVDAGTANMHKLVVLDVTPVQWEEIQANTRSLPEGWTLEGNHKLSGGRARKRK